jgi:hypothetical protein
LDDVRAKGFRVMVGEYPCKITRELDCRGRSQWWFKCFDILGANAQINPMTNGMKKKVRYRTSRIEWRIDKTANTRTKVTAAGIEGTYRYRAKSTYCSWLVLIARSTGERLKLDQR